MINRELEYESKDLLQKFISEILVFLEQLAIEGFDTEGRPLFLEEQLERIKGAWEEFRGDFDVKRANVLIKRAEADKLQSHGLYGKQLNLKLSVIESWQKRFFGRRTKKVLLRLFDAIDTLLDSLLSATGIDKALKEIKDVLRNSIDED